MRKIFFLVFSIIIMQSMVLAQWPDNVTVINLEGNDSVTVKGDLANGALMEDLSWAWNSSNACFPATQVLKFMGNHVLYAVTMPGQCELKISVSPTDENGDLSIYAYRIGTSSYDVVPKLARCITCEADHKWDRKWKNKVQTSERHVSFQTPIARQYTIVIGVTAPKGVTTGDFDLKVKVIR